MGTCMSHPCSHKALLISFDYFEQLRNSVQFMQPVIGCSPSTGRAKNSLFRMIVPSRAAVMDAKPLGCRI